MVINRVKHRQGAGNRVSGQRQKKGREAIAGTEQNDTPEDLGDPDIPEYPWDDQERPKDQRNPEDPNDSEDDNYLPL